MKYQILHRLLLQRDQKIKGTPKSGAIHEIHTTINQKNTGISNIFYIANTI